METLYYNGNIITMEDGGEPEAVIVKDGIISFVGSQKEAEKIIDAKSERKDLKGHCLMPSFIDSHSHVFTNGQMSLCAELGECNSYEDVINTLKSFMKEKKIGPNGAVIGFGYDHNFLREGGQPDKRVLDKVSVDIPVIILHVSVHMACVNSKALELSGITNNTQDPQGGMIGRLEDGKEPSGYLEEAGMAFVQSIIAKNIKSDIEAMASGMQKAYIENGVTTVQDGATTEGNLKALKMISDLGKLKLDVVAYPLISSDGEELLHNNRELCGKYKNHLKIGGYKLVLDGSPQGRSAWMSKPYLNGAEGYCGYPWMEDEEVKKYVKTAIEDGQQILAHCNGDAASEQYITAYEAAIKETGSKEDLRPVMIHCQTVRNDQLDRMAKLNMIASIFVGHVYYWGDVHIKNLGPERGNHISPVKDALDYGIKVNFHQDTPITRPDMLHSVWCAVNRISRSGAVIGQNQKISVYEALKAVTIDAAYEYFEEDSKGSIRAGKHADLVILDRSPLKIDPLEIRDIQVIETIKDGKTIYAGSFH